MKLVMKYHTDTFCMSDFFFLLFDSSDCYWLLETLLQYTAYNNLSPMFSGHDSIATSLPPLDGLPTRMEGNSYSIMTLQIKKGDHFEITRIDILVDIIQVIPII